MPKNEDLSASFTTKSGPSDGDGNQIHNEILLSLPTAERELLLSGLEFVRLENYRVLHEPGDLLTS
ncbi:MAG TPA: hypothetical protein VGK34_00360, partial [Armatimonadota bacterium]